MASHDDLMCIIKSLLESLDKLGGNFSEVKSVADRLTAVEENMCTKQDVKVIADRLTNIERKVALLSTSEEVKIIAVKQTGLGDKMCTSEQAKVISDKLNTLEHRVSTSEEVKIIESRMARLEDDTRSVRASWTNKEASLKPLQFHPKVRAKNVKLTNDFRTAERIRGREDLGLYASVVSQWPLCDDEVFEFQIDETIKCEAECGIGFGVIKGPDAKISTSCSPIYDGNLENWAVHSAQVSFQGTSYTMKDASVVNSYYPLDTRYLRVGTILGVSRRQNGDLHFYLNGDDKGVAFKGVPEGIHVFIEIRGYVRKISILN